MKLDGAAVKPWDPSPSVDRVPAGVEAEEGQLGQLILVQNFFEELKERVGN